MTDETTTEDRVSIELQYFDGCPHWQIAEARLTKAASAIGAHIEHRLITTPEEAEAAGFLGSPSIKIDGRDPFARGDEPTGLSCRLYQTPDGPAGSPTVEQIEEALHG